MRGKSPGVFLKTTFTVHIKITIGIILSVLCIMVVASYALVPSAREELTFTVAVVGGAAAVYTGYYVAATLRLSVENNRKLKAFEILRDMNQPELVLIRDIIDQKVNIEKVALEKVHETIITEGDLRTAVTTQLDLFEDMAIAIGQDCVDEGVLYLSLMRLVPRIYDQLQHYIRTERKLHNSDVIYSEFEHLAEAWKKHRSVLTGNLFTYAPE